jgi:tRNA (cmo5U34)-methyltransferase
MNEFDIKASGWDANPMHLERSEAIVGRILNEIPVTTDMVALEYGAGTGLSSFLLKDNLRNITLMDNSSEMIRIMQEKIEETKAKNLKAINFDLEHNDYGKELFDLIFTQMVLHHVADIDTLFRRFGDLLKRGGFLSIADLYTEDGSFHGEGFTGHKGFNPEELADTLRQHQFFNISYKPCFTINRKISDTEIKKYDLFLLVARRQ